MNSPTRYSPSAGALGLYRIVLFTRALSTTYSTIVKLSLPPQSKMSSPQLESQVPLSLVGCLGNLLVGQSVG